MATLETAYKKVKELAKAFKESEDTFLHPDYSEARVRDDFIDAFFNALGWDVTHDIEKNPHRQEVKIEKSVADENKRKRRADYAFSLAPNYKSTIFIVEAKKPARDLLNEDDYFQSIRYATNTNTPIVVLTDFEEFHVIDARFKTTIDTALHRKIKEYRYYDYADKEKFAEIYYLFSREAVAENSIQEYADSLAIPKSKAALKTYLPKGTKSVDESLLDELEEIREILAKAFKKANPSLDSYELTEATQRTIDRLVFLRFLEDKLLEPDLLVSRFARSKTPWKDFSLDSIRLNAKYNGIVFHNHFIDETSFKPPAARTFVDVCNRLTNPDYYYDVIPIHILGSIYERFLGSVVHATAKQATIEQKPEVKKAGGVYYTPEYIVRYIVENTIGKLIEGKSPLQISRMRFADIACGSGSFLISVFDFFLDYHSNWYNDNPKKAKEDGCIYIKEEDKWVVSLKQKRKILVNNIYGVDIDQQAVEVTELSLYLKLLEDETTATAHEMSSLFTLLPDLKNNIVCGNSLVAPDILSSDLFSGEEERQLNPMDFDNAFPVVKDKGGFDAIVGNPPWVRQELISDSKSYFETHYQTYHGSADLYQYFIEKGISLLNPQGIFSYIVPNKWMRADYGTPLRAWLKKHKIKEITDFGDLRVFETATTYPCIIIAKKASVKSDYSFDVTQVSTLDFADLGDYVKANRYRITTSSLDESGWSLASETEQKLLQKISKDSVSLDTYIDGKIYRGILTGLDKAFVLDEATAKQLIKSDKNSKKIIKPYQAGKDIKRYSFSDTKRFVIFLPKGFTKSNCPDKNYWNWFLKEYPAVAKHLAAFEEPAKKRYDKGDFYWELRACEYYDEFAKPKITFLKFQVKPAFSYDTEEFVVNSAGFIIPQDDKYLLGILNSPLGWYIVSKLCTQIQSGYQLIWKYLKKFPIHKIDFSNKSEKATHDKIVLLVNGMLEAQKKLASAKMHKDTAYYERKTTNISREIDREVYKLYGLSKDEIDIIEKGSSD